jgi:hypothetical protein
MPKSFGVNVTWRWGQNLWGERRLRLQGSRVALRAKRCPSGVPWSSTAP